MLKAPRSLSSPTSSASLLTQTVKNLSAMQETQVQFLGQEDPWRRKWQPTPVFLPGESHGQRSLVGYSSWGREELDTTEQLTHTWYELQHQTELTGWCHERHTLALQAHRPGVQACCGGTHGVPLDIGQGQ